MTPENVEQAIQIVAAAWIAYLVGKTLYMGARYLWIVYRPMTKAEEDALFERLDSRRP